MRLGGAGYVGKRRRGDALKLGGEGVDGAEAGIGVEDGADIVGRDGAFAADAPVIAAKFDDGGGQDAVGLSGIQD